MKYYYAFNGYEFINYYKSILNKKIKNMLIFIKNGGSSE